MVTEATASLKKIDDKQKEIPWRSDRRAKPIVDEQESVVISEITTEDTIQDFVVQSTSDQAQLIPDDTGPLTVSETKVQEIRKTGSRKSKKVGRTERRLTITEVIREQKEEIAKEVEELMDILSATDFGPGESPLRELATIGYLVRQGVSVIEINESLYQTDKFPALKTPDAQSALVQLVEREGHGPLISQVLTEETTTDESIVAATVGFRAFMKMVELLHATVEEVITHFAPEDFRPHAWEVTEATEVRIPT